ncbi:MAG: PAS domain S-box protein, partial [Cyclobacteriaceae bacterium]|nr:PAS domain S-box protein [Cyclobacteriaceae bacterium]
VLLSTENNEKFLSSDINLIERASEGIYFSNVNPDRNSIFCAAPLVHVNNEVTVLIIELGMEKVYAMLADSIGMGKSGENLIARKMDNQIQYLVPFKGDSVLKKVPFDSSENNRPMKEALLGRSGSKVTRDYNGEDVLAVWRFIPNVEWGFVAKVNTSEIMSASNQLQDNFLISGLVIIFLSSVISIVYSKFLVAPLLSLKNKIELISKGILPNSIEKLSNDEIGKMAVTVNNLSKGLKRTADFAKEIGKGNLEAKYTSLGREDILGRNLLEMRESLVRRETDDKERTWIISGMAEISEILRNNDKINSLTSKVIEFIVRRIDVVQGAIYITADDDVKEKLVELVATYAYNRKKYLEGRFEFAQGLVGQVVAEKSPIYRIEIPEDYVTITSGILGDKKPSCLMLVPIITNEEIFGVIEVAGFGEISKEKQGFLVEVGEVLARTIYNIKVNGRTRVLLEESRTMARELKQNQEVLSQNAEEMRATQEELQLSNNKLEEQVEEVNKTQKRMQLLLENASEVITIYEEDLVVRYMSPSVESILGYSFKELVGSTDIDKVHPNHQEIYKEMFSDLLTKPKKSVTIQFRYKHKNGNYLWVEAKGTNFLSDKAINGIIINLRDITEKRRAEQEQRMRSKMQALSENSLDIITRLEDGKISYINPVIKGYTGKSPQNFINKKVDEIELNQQIVEQWLTIVEQVNKTNKIVNREMDFPSENNTHVMQVNAIPEFDENKIIESVLLVSHDITERKYIELEIQNKNKKIADSINYAKRIQNAILPDNNLINKKLPDSFILYKPKDVVSGDFPWFAVVDNYLFIAAVDCTGHGVPGALLSLIGYFLLNDIVRSRKIFEPGIILDKLDEGVT